MFQRNKLVCLIAVSSAIVAFTLSAYAASDWKVANTFHVGGEGGWDYVTVEPATHRLYVTRSTHTMVLDSESGKTIADIPGQKRSHGTAVVPSAGRGFISDGGGEGAIVIFDLNTNQVLGSIKAQADADGIIYDKFSNTVLAVSGDGGTLMTLKPDTDPKTGKLDSIIDLGGKPEFLASDEAGKIYVNLEDKNQVAVVDIKTKKVLAHWPVAPGGSPVGMAIDRKNHRIFVGCRNPQKMIVMSTDDGKVIADLPISAGVDATKFDGNQAFASCRDGKLHVAAETSPGKYEIVQIVTTPQGARTMDVDPGAEKIYLPTAELEAAQSGGRPAMKPGTFMIVVVAKNK
jgi:DNA-binding beta-propeller fold protein YncE